MSLPVIIIGITIASAVIASTTSWLLSLNAKISNLDGHLEAMTIAISEWNRLNAMPMDAIEAQKDKLANYTVGEYQLSVILGDKGVMNEGTCKTTGLGTDEELNCYNDSKVIIKKDGETLYSSKLLPLSADGSGGGGGVELDYDKRQNVSFPFNVPKNGIIYLTIYYRNEPQPSTKGGFYYINGKYLCSDYTDASWNSVRSTKTVFVSKGDVITFNGGYHGNDSYFVPFK